MRARAFVLVGSLVACGGPPAPPAAPESAAPQATSQPAADDAPAPSGPFDRAAASKAIGAVDLASCYEKPPFLEENLHVTLTVMPNGTIKDAAADRPYASTEAGACAVELLLKVRVAPYVGPPVQMGRTVPHAPQRGNKADGRFDSTIVRQGVDALDMHDCLGDPGAGIEKGAANILVAPSGDVRSVVVEPPLGGTPRGECIVKILKAVQFKPYGGDPAPATRVEFDLRSGGKKK